MSKKNLETKKSLGQFFTTNYEYILQDLNIPKYVEHIIEPFCGNGDLLNFQNIKNDSRFTLECYDIETKQDFIIERDTILNPPDYTNKFIITNPPYLARNKSQSKEIFDKYDVNDLYKCFIKNIIKNKCLGGIIIIPLNFWSSIRKCDCDLRRDFLSIYNINHMNIFEEQVFDDTSYTICSFQFEDKSLNSSDESISITIYPSKKSININLNENNEYLIGGEIYNLPKKSIYKVSRATCKNENNLNTNLLVKCIDDSESSKIGLSLVSDDKIYIDKTPNLSSRTYASLIIEPEISIDRQEQLVYQFNTFLEEHREKYHSLFLTNYRESKDIARKRISFELVYDIIIYILENT